MLAEFWSSFWVTRGRQRVSSVLQTCRLCKILEGLNYPAPVQAELPDFRVDGGIAFKNTGVDFGGPVYTKEAEEMRKSYIVLFTCATSRMVHLELCPNLTTEAYVRSQKRMIGRRGAPVMFVSDNGRTFKGKGLKRFNAERGIRWRFNLSRAPWWGGMFERLIRSTKRCLKKAIGRRRLTYEELETVLIDVEAVLNSRPLTYLYANDTDTPITPSHLFCGRRLLDQHEDTGKDDVTIPKMNRKNTDNFKGFIFRTETVSGFIETLSAQNDSQIGVIFYLCRVCFPTGFQWYTLNKLFFYTLANKQPRFRI